MSDSQHDTPAGTPAGGNGGNPSPGTRPRRPDQPATRNRVELTATRTTADMDRAARNHVGSDAPSEQP